MEAINHYRRLSDGRIVLTADTCLGEIVFMIFDDVNMFEVFIKDCIEFRDRCMGKDIPLVYREAFRDVI